VIIYSCTVCDFKHGDQTKDKKLNVIRDLKANSVTLWVETANHLGLAPSSSTITLNKNKTTEGEMKCGAHSKKRKNIQLGVNEGLEMILLEWLQQMCSENVPISRTLLCQKAVDIALHLKIDNFNASNASLHRHLKSTHFSV
jgi:hypothetical protein